MLLTFSSLLVPVPARAPVPIVSPSAGAVSDTHQQILRKHLNPILKGKYWDAILAALAKGDQYVRETAALVANQLNLSTANGSYLERRADEVGVSKPVGVGIGDELFRQLAISLSSAKVTTQSLLDVLDVYFGDDALRATLTSDVAQPYAIVPGSGFSVLVDERDSVTVTFLASDFQDANNAKAQEVAAAINRAFALFKLKAFALPVATTAGTQVRLYSGALGLASSLRVTGGQAQNSLQFSQLLPVYGVVTLSAPPQASI